MSGTTTSAITARGTIGGFVAGLALAGAIAVGVNVGSPSHASPTPSPAVAASSSVGVPLQSLDADCRKIVHGHC